jgi:hypothetical protein
MMRRFLIVAVVLLCAAGLGTEGRGADDGVPDATTLRARMAAAIGPANENYRDTVIEHDADGDVLITHAQRGANWLETKGGTYRTTSGTFNGMDWHQDLNGITYADVPDPGAAARTKITTTVQRVASPVEAYVLSAIDEDGFGYRLYVDPVSYLVKRRDNIGTDGSTIVTFADYKRYGTQLMPASWTITDLSDKSSTTYTRTSFSIGVATDADVAVPPVRQLVNFPPGVSNVDLHATFVGPTSLITIPITIGNRQVYFMVDSGASELSIDPAVAASLGLKSIGSTIVEGVAKEHAGEVVIPSMDISGIRINNVVVDTIPFGSGRTPDDPAGLIGFDFIAEAVLNVDTAHHRVIATDPRVFTQPTGRNLEALPIRLGDRIPLISMNVGGAIAERMVVDTGSDDTLLMFGYFQRRHTGVFRDRPNHDALQSIDPTPHYGFGEGIGGETDIHRTSVPYIHLGRRTIAEVPVDVISGRHGFAWNVDGLLGRQILDAFDVVFDYEDGMIFLWPANTSP